MSVAAFTELNSINLMVEFEIKLGQLITIFYLLLQKSNLLLKDKKIAENRANDLPSRLFDGFVREITPKIGI